MAQTARTIWKVFVSVLVGLFSLPPLIYGGYLLLCWFRIHFSNAYYVDYGYLTPALVWTAAGILSLWATWYGVSRRGILLVVPVFLGLATMASIPNSKPSLFSMSTDTRCLSVVNSNLKVWYEEKQRFPANDFEFREAMAKGPEPWGHSVGATRMSRYRQRGSLLPYEIAVVTNASGPRLTDGSQRPGVIYYCVSSDLQEFWVTLTGLQSEVASTATIRRNPHWPEQWMAHAAGRNYPAEKH